MFKKDLVANSGEIACRGMLMAKKKEIAKSRGFLAHEIGGIVMMVETHSTAFPRGWHEYP